MRKVNSYKTLVEIVEALEENKIGNNMSYVSKNYTIEALANDLKEMINKANAILEGINDEL